MEKSDKGISTIRVAWQVCVPEQNGGIEPTMVGGKSAARLKGMTDVVYDTVPMPDNIDFLIRRTKTWHRIQKKPNVEKKIAILYWNHPPGKQNVGASYLNLFRSIANILPAMKKNGYKIEGGLPTEKDKVVGLEPIPGAILKRPRIDVLLQTSGLYRDSFPQVIKLLDRAVRMAGSLKDVENFVAIHNEKIKKALLKKGYSKDDANELCQARVFGPMPGAYVHALQELIPASGVWETDEEIADVWIHHYSYAYGDKLWGKSLKSAYKSNLKDVKVTMHSVSSNVYYMLDNDDMFAFLGGLSLAVKSQTGVYPDVMVANLQDRKDVKLDDLAKAIGKAL